MNALHILLSGILFQLPDGPENRWCYPWAARSDFNIERIRHLKTLAQHREGIYANLHELVGALLAPCAEDTATLTTLFLAQDTSGNTPFHYAFRKGQTKETIALLLSFLKRCSPSAKKNLVTKVNKNGETILHCALSVLNASQLYDFIEALGTESLRPSFFLETKKGHTIFHFLCANSCFDKTALMQSLRSFMPQPPFFDLLLEMVDQEGKKRFTLGLPRTFR